MPRIICVAGARPNFMKVKPVMDALEARGAEVVLVHTGQHYDAAMNDVFFADLGLRTPDRHLGTGSGVRVVGHDLHNLSARGFFEALGPESVDGTVESERAAQGRTGNGTVRDTGAQ